MDVEETSRLPLPDAFLNFLNQHDLDPSIYTATDSIPRYIRYSLQLVSILLHLLVFFINNF